MTKPTLSIVIPCYNAASWLPGTIQKASESLRRAGITTAEFVIVDDGSTDGSVAAAETATSPYPIHVMRRPHQGRFRSRKAGVAQAKYDHILFIDARVHLHEGSLSFLVDQLRAHPDRQIWNGHVVVAKEGNIIARFGDAITYIGWRRYFRRPHTTSYGLKDFDHYPKGTGCFFVPKAPLMAAIVEFESTTNDLEHSSDDTLLIRILARTMRINLSPSFSCTYHARTSLRQFARHSYGRGQFFIDGFLRPGTRFFYPLIAVLAGSAALLVLLVIRPDFIVPLLIVGLVGWAAELAIALSLGTPAKDALSLFALTPVFTLFYWLGLWRGLARKFAA